MPFSVFHLSCVSNVCQWMEAVAVNMCFSSVYLSGFSQLRRAASLFLLLSLSQLRLMLSVSYAEQMASCALSDVMQQELSG